MTLLKMADINEKIESSAFQLGSNKHNISRMKNIADSKSQIFLKEKSSSDKRTLAANTNNNANFINIDEWNQLAGSKNTKRVTASSVKLFRQFIKETKGGRVDFENFEEESLIDLLIKFFTTLRKPDGDLYTKNGLLSIRFGLRRHLLDLHKADITKHPRINSVFTAQINKLKREGKGEINHYPPISKEDMVKIYSSGVFSLDDPKGLLRKVFFETEMFFCRRGRENLRDLKGNHFKIGIDTFGKKYLSTHVDLECGPRLLHRGQSLPNVGKNGFIYETGTALCPVKSFEKFLAKRHPCCDAFFQRAPETVPVSFNENEPWYHCCGLGLNKMTNMMREISLDAELSKMYTNHSIRATSTAVFDIIWSKDFPHGIGVSSNNDICNMETNNGNQQATMKCKTNNNTIQKIVNISTSQKNIHFKEPVRDLQSEVSVTETHCKLCLFNLKIIVVASTTNETLAATLSPNSFVIHFYRFTVSIFD